MNSILILVVSCILFLSGCDKTFTENPQEQGRQNFETWKMERYDSLPQRTYTPLPDFKSRICKTFPTGSLWEVKKNPQKYVGALCAFHGSVENMEESGGKTMMQMSVWDDERDSDKPYLMVVMEKENIHLDKGYIVNVMGKIAGEITGVNAFGGPAKQVVLLSIAVVDVDDKPIYHIENDPTYEKWMSGELFKDRL